MGVNFSKPVERPQYCGRGQLVIEFKIGPSRNYQLATGEGNNAPRTPWSEWVNVKRRAGN